MPNATQTVFDRDQMARRYARRHLEIDDGVDTVLHLPEGAPPREIRLLEVNTLVAEMTPLEAIDFGVDIGSDSAHTLFVLDVTPDQWLAVQAGSLPLPDGWSLTGAGNLAPRQVMNGAQNLWWRQARSDYELFATLRRGKASECHLLHYLQMATEKLSKAYLWRSGNPPPMSHTGFVRFVRAVVDRNDLQRVAPVLGFANSAGLEKWAKGALLLAYSLQNIAPAEANGGPNPEYPWPHDAPAHCPVDHDFTLWSELVDTGKGRKMLEFIGHAISRFDEIA